MAAKRWIIDGKEIIVWCQTCEWWPAMKRYCPPDCIAYDPPCPSDTLPPEPR